MHGVVDLECSVQLRNFYQRENLFPEAYKFEHAAVFAHLSFGDQESTESTAVTELDLRKIDDQMGEPGAAENKELAFELGRDRRIKIALFQLEDSRASVLLDFEVHDRLRELEHFET